MSEPTGDREIDAILADADEIPERPLAEQPEALTDVYDRLAAQLSDQ